MKRNTTKPKPKRNIELPFRVKIKKKVLKR